MAIMAEPITPATASDQEIKSYAVEAKLGHPRRYIWDDLGYHRPCTGFLSCQLRKP
jgi:hypothetical protein